MKKSFLSLSGYWCGNAWIPLIVAIAAILAFVNSFPGQFIWDDNSIVIGNDIIRTINLNNIFSTDYWGSGLSNLYRPLTILSLAVNNKIFGGEAFGYHLVNVLLHALISIQVWVALRSWDLRPEIAALAALLFAVHPIHGEVVNVVVGRSELLAALFMLLGLAAASRTGRGAAFTAGICSLLALLSKEHAVIFLPMIVVLDVHRNVEGSRQKLRWWLYLWLLLVTLFWFCLRSYAVPQLVGSLPQHPEFAPLYFLPATERILSALQIQWIYLWKLLLPVYLQGTYSGPKFIEAITFIWSWRGVTFLTASVMFVILVVRFWQVRTAPALIAILYLISILPTSNLFFPIGTSFAERVLYFPSIWFCAGIAAVLCHCLKWRSKILLGIWIGFGYFLLLLTLCLLRNQDYGTPERLWRSDISRDPGNLLAWFNLADELAQDESRSAETDKIFRKILTENADFTPAWRLYANFLYRSQRYKEALDAAKKAIAGQDDLQGNFLLAQMYYENSDYQGSLRQLEQVASLAENFVGYWELRCRNLLRLGRHAEAIDVFYRLVDKSSSNTDFLMELNSFLIEQRRFDEAKEVLDRALAKNIWKNRAVLLNSLGVVLAQQGRFGEASAAFAKAVSEDPHNQYYRQNLERARENAQRTSPSAKADPP